MFAELMIIYESWPFSMGLVESNVMNSHGDERERRVLKSCHVLGGTIGPHPKCHAPRRCASVTAMNR